MQGVMQKNGRALFSYEMIGAGGLALRARHALGWVSRLADELSLLAYNSRPDVDPKMSKILVSLKNAREPWTVLNGQLLFLKESEQGKGVLLSDVPTALWVKPILLDNGAVLVEAGRKLLSKEGREGEEKGQFMLSSEGAGPARQNPMQQAFLQELKTARTFSQDLLVQKYGGREYAAWREKAPLEFAHGCSTYALFVSPGDYLVYREGEWRIAPRGEWAPDLPLAHIKALSSKAVEVEAWDETGFHPVQIKIEMEKIGRLQPKPEALPSAIRLRSNTQISCAFGKRRILLRQGDWLLKTQTGWRLLKRAEEIDNYLHHRLKGELFIFDGVEKEQGGYVLKGNLFDETRTQVQPLSLPVDGDKVQSKAPRKRKPFAERRAP